MIRYGWLLVLLAACGGSVNIGSGDQVPDAGEAESEVAPDAQQEDAGSEEASDEDAVEEDAQECEVYCPTHPGCAPC
ncbi:MAG: hypothetical protein WC683_02895 [bacterium]